MSPWRNGDNKVWSGVLGGIPEQLSSFANEPAFSIQNTTFCIWRLVDQTSWQRGEVNFPEVDDADGSSWMMEILDGSPQSYKQWAEGYYERSVPLEAVEAVYRHEPLTPPTVALLNPSASLAALAAELDEIGFPYNLI